MQTHVRYAPALIVVMSMVLSYGARSSMASDAFEIPERSAALCAGAPASIPATIQVDEDLRPAVEATLRRSQTFRQQCRRLARTPLLYVRVRQNPRLVDRSYRARTEIQRFKSGVVIAVVELRPLYSTAEWIAHEFEHILEQVDGVRLADLADKFGYVWRTAERMFETERAIRAGRVVAGEVRQRKPGNYGLVE